MKKGRHPGGNRGLVGSIMVKAWVSAFAGMTAFVSVHALPLVTERAQKEIKKRLEQPSLVIKGERILRPDLTQRFYESRQYKLAWSRDKGPADDCLELVNTLEKADREGLNPHSYHLDLITRLMKEIANDKKSRRSFSANLAADLDLALTDAFLSYGTHLVSGLVDPTVIDDEWFSPIRKTDMPAMLEEAFERNGVRDMLKSFHPKQPYYARLRLALSRYRTIAINGGWPTISSGTPLKKRVADPRVRVLRQRLIIEGDLKPYDNDTEIFDKILQKGLMRFQERHGLEPDGVVGPGTLKALNVSVDERIQQIILNMERCRWILDDLGERYILVNVANFGLEVIEKNDVTMDMKVIIGRPYRHTPIFSSTMSHIVVNPPWSVPKKIASTDILEHIHEEPDYLAKHHFTVYDGYGENSKVVDPATIDWVNISTSNNPYRFRQAPGVTNALGRIKFLFPNRFDVYLHDTPSRELFKKTIRNFSSGCIRIEKPIELARYLLRGDEKTLERFEMALNKKDEQALPLPEPMPIHIMYWTAWVNEGGDIQFREDIYDRDFPLAQELNSITFIP